MKRDQNPSPGGVRQVFGWGACLTLALAGWLWARHHLESVQAADVAASVRRQEIRQLQQKKTEARAARIDQPSAVPPPRHEAGTPPPSPENLRSRALANLTMLIKSRYIQVVLPRGVDAGAASDVLSPDATGAFPPDFAKLFQLSEADFAALQEFMTAMKQKVDAELVGSTTVERDPSGSIVMTTRALPEGAAMKEQFRQVLQSTLGPENFDLFLNLRSTARTPGLTAIDGFFSGFGSEARITTIPRNERGYGLPVAGNDRSATVRFQTTTRQNVVKSLGPLAPLLPADF